AGVDRSGSRYMAVRRPGDRSDRAAAAGIGRHPRRHDPHGRADRRRRAGGAGIRAAVQADQVSTGLFLLLQEGDAGHTVSPFDINTGLIFWTVLIFLVLLAVLWKAAWPAILKSVEARELRIKKQLDEVERALAEDVILWAEH